MTTSQQLYNTLLQVVLVIIPLVLYTIVSLLVRVMMTSSNSSSGNKNNSKNDNDKNKQVSITTLRQLSNEANSNNNNNNSNEEDTTTTIMNDNEEENDNENEQNNNSNTSTSNSHSITILTYCLFIITQMSILLFTLLSSSSSTNHSTTHTSAFDYYNKLVLTSQIVMTMVFLNSGIFMLCKMVQHGLYNTNTILINSFNSFKQSVLVVIKYLVPSVMYFITSILVLGLLLSTTTISNNGSNVPVVVSILLLDTIRIVSLAIIIIVILVSLVMHFIGPITEFILIKVRNNTSNSTNSSNQSTNSESSSIDGSNAINGNCNPIQAVVVVELEDVLEPRQEQLLVSDNGNDCTEDDSKSMVSIELVQAEESQEQLQHGSANRPALLTRNQQLVLLKLTKSLNFTRSMATEMCIEAAMLSATMLTLLLLTSILSYYCTSSSSTATSMGAWFLVVQKMAITLYCMSSVANASITVPLVKRGTTSYNNEEEGEEKQQEQEEQQQPEAQEQEETLVPVKEEQKVEGNAPRKEMMNMVVTAV